MIRRGLDTAGPLLLLLGALACLEDDLILVEPSWSPDEIAVFLLSPAGQVPSPENTELFIEGDGTKRPFSFDAPKMLRAWTFPRDLAPSHGPPLAECGVVFGGFGEPLAPHARARYQTEVIEEGALGALAFAPDPKPPSLDLRFAACGIITNPCEAIRWSRVPVPPGLILVASAYVASDHLIVAGHDEAVPSDLRFLRLRGLSLEPMPSSGYQGRLRDLAFDGADTLYLTASVEELEDSPLALFRFDLEGRHRSGPYAFGMRGVAAGRDGFALAYSDAGLFEMRPDSDDLIPRPDLGGFPKVGGRSYLEVVSGDRFFGYANDVVLAYDGNSWQDEYRRVLTQDVSGLGGDAEVMVLVGGTEYVTRRDESSGAWFTFEDKPFDRAVRFRDAGGLTQGRFIVVGDRGTFAVHVEGRWCPVDTQIEVEFTHVETSTDGATAWVLGPPIADGETGSVLLRIDR